MKKLLIALSAAAPVGCAQIDQTERVVILEFGNDRMMSIVDLK